MFSQKTYYLLGGSWEGFVATILGVEVATREDTVAAGMTEDGNTVVGWIMDETGIS